jgi:DNA-binding NarL/FixJ family response regulator
MRETKMVAIPEERSEAIRHRLVGEPVPLVTQARPYQLRDATNEGGAASQSTTREISSRNVVISVAVVDEYSFTRESISRSLREICNRLDIVSFATCDECRESKLKFDLILYHAHESVANQNNNDERLALLKKMVLVAPVIILCDVDSVPSIRAAFDSGARGYIPTVSTTLELAIEIMYLVKVGGTFIPPSSLSSRAIKPQGTPNAFTTLQFTPREIAVLECLKLGKTNKIIAYELEISESSVKTHIQNIMKKMKATNRTEVACRAHELEMSATRSTR